MQFPSFPALQPFARRFFGLGQKLVGDYKYLFLISIYLSYRLSMMVSDFFPWAGPFLFSGVLLMLLLFFSPQVSNYFLLLLEGEGGDGKKGITGVSVRNEIGLLFVFSLLALLLFFATGINYFVLLAGWGIFMLPLVAETWGKIYTSPRFARLQVFSLALALAGLVSAFSEAILSILFIPFLAGIFGFHYFRDWILGDSGRA
jgi:hypothetical protein